MTEQFHETTRGNIYQIDPKKIVIKAGFNKRQQFVIDDLKESIVLQGMLNPITVIPFKSEDGVEKYRLVDGERRYRAVMQAISEGADIIRIKALYAPRSKSELDLVVEQVLRNEGERYSDYENGLVYQELYDGGYTQTEIALKLSVKAAYVSKCLSLLGLAPEIQQSLSKGEVSTTTALKIVETHKEDEVKQVEVVKKAIETAKENGKTKATVKHIVDENVVDKANTELAKKFIKVLMSRVQSVSALHNLTQTLDINLFIGEINSGLGFDQAIKESLDPIDTDLNETA